MKRQPLSPYADSNMNSYAAASQMQHQLSGQRMRHNQPGMGYPGRPESDCAEVDHPYKSSKMEGQWQWDRDAQNLSNQMPSHGFNGGLGGDAVRSYYAPDCKPELENQAMKEDKAQHQEQDMEVGYEDNTLPLTFEGLERKFHDDVIRLAKEQSEAEDAENARHRDKIIEINTRYQEKLSALRAQQANRREEFLRKESQARLSQYQQAGMSNNLNSGLQGAGGYSGTVDSGATAEAAYRNYPSAHLDSHRDRPQYTGGGRTQVSEGRVPYPHGRVYNNSGGRYY